MTVNTAPHLNFRGDARAALDFHQSVFGGSFDVVTYADAHSVTDPEAAGQVMWGQVASEASFRLMAYDVPGHTPWDPGAIPFFVSVRGTGTDEVAGYWQKLADGATVGVQFGPAQWSPGYAMLRDRFGVTWVLDVEVACSSPD